MLGRIGGSPPLPLLRRVCSRPCVSCSRCSGWVGSSLTLHFFPHPSSIGIFIFWRKVWLHKGVVVPTAQRSQRRINSRTLHHLSLSLYYLCACIFRDRRGPGSLCSVPGNAKLALKQDRVNSRCIQELRGRNGVVGPAITACTAKERLNRVLKPMRL